MLGTAGIPPVIKLASCRECSQIIVGAKQTKPYPLCYRCFENI